MLLNVDYQKIYHTQTQDINRKVLSGNKHVNHEQLIMYISTLVHEYTAYADNRTCAYCKNIFILGNLDIHIIFLLL